MGWFEKLKSICNIEIPSFESLIKITIINNCNNGNKFEKDDGDKILKVNLARLTPSEKNKIEDVIRELYDQNGHILEDKSQTLIQDFKEKEQSGAAKEVLGYFKEIIPSEDLNILRAAIYIDTVSRSGESVGPLKARVIQRYGPRGNNLVNLYTAGYFNTWLKPLYEALRESHDEQQAILRFQKIYKNIVDELPWTVFVGFSKTQDQWRDEILEKLARNIGYGIKFINIHAIGRANIELVRNILPEIEKAYPALQRDVREEGSRISIRLLLKD